MGSTFFYACFDLMIKSNYYGVKLWVQILPYLSKKGMWKLSWDSCILNHRSIVGSTSVYSCFDLMIKSNYQGVKL